MDDSGIQHKRTQVAPSGFGFDDASERVPVGMPEDSDHETGISDDDANRVRRETIARFLAHLLQAGTAEEVGRMVLIIAYSLRLPDGPRTLEEVGALFCTGGRLGVGKARVSQILSSLNLESDAFSRLSDPNSATR